MDCEQAELEMYSRYIDNEMKEEEKEELKQHIRECDSCRAEWQDAQNVVLLEKNIFEILVCSNVGQKPRIAMKIIIAAIIIAVTIFVGLSQFTGKKIIEKKEPIVSENKNLENDSNTTRSSNKPKFSLSEESIRLLKMLEEHKRQGKPKLAVAVLGRENAQEDWSNLSENFVADQCSIKFRIDNQNTFVYVFWISPQGKITIVYPSTFSDSPIKTGWHQTLPENCEEGLNHVYFVAVKQRWIDFEKALELAQNSPSQEGKIVENLGITRGEAIDAELDDTFIEYDVWIGNDGIIVLENVIHGKN